MKQTDRLALLDWEKYKEDIARATPVDRNMTAAEREKHREYLEKHPIEWIKFFFPNYAKYEFADFQKKAIRRIIAHDEWFEVLSWSRELAKSTVTMFIVMNLTLTGRKKNVILTSNSKDNAVRLLDPYRANLEANGRIMAYYGKQELPGSWTEDEFTTKGKVSFRALGAGQSPRGSRNEATFRRLNTSAALPVPSIKRFAPICPIPGQSVRAMLQIRSSLFIPPQITQIHTD